MRNTSLSRLIESLSWQILLRTARACADVLYERSVPVPAEQSTQLSLAQSDISPMFAILKGQYGRFLLETHFHTHLEPSTQM